jgi:hypothetical protein
LELIVVIRNDSGTIVGSAKAHFDAAEAEGPDRFMDKRVEPVVLLALGAVRNHGKMPDRRPVPGMPL